MRPKSKSSKIGLNPDLAKIKLHDDTGAGAQLLESD